MADPRVVELGRRRVELEKTIAQNLTRAMHTVGDFGSDPQAVAAIEEVVAAERELVVVKRKLQAHLSGQWEGTVRRRVLAVMETRRDKTWPLSRIVARVDATPNAIRQALHVLVRERVVDNVSRGLYRLAHPAP